MYYDYNDKEELGLKSDEKSGLVMKQIENIRIETTPHTLIYIKNLKR